MSDPKRLLDDARDDDLSRLLSAGKSETPDGAQLGALAAKVGILGGLGGAGALGAGGAGGGAAGGGGAGVSAGAGAGAGAGGAASAGTVGVTAAKAGLALKIGGAAVVAATAVGGSAVVVKSVRHETPQTPTGIVATIAPPAAASVNGAGSMSGTVVLPLPSSEASDPAAPTTSARPATKPSVNLGPEAEVRLLERAQDALRSRPAEALSLAEEHERDFPRGMLVQEREVIAIEALVKTGRMDEARARAARFKGRFPGSTHTRRIDALLGQ